MEIIRPYFVIEDEVNGERILKNLERYGRVCYKSESKITLNSARDFIKRVLERGHEAVIEHEKVTVRVICDRGVTHEIVRHRLASYCQESTRYCNYKSLGIQVIEPFFFVGSDEKYIVMTYNIREWRHFFKVRCSKGANPQMREIGIPLLNEFQKMIPILFDDIRAG